MQQALRNLIGVDSGIALLTVLVASSAVAVFALRRWRDLDGEIADRMAAESRLRTLALRDELTGLGNRRALQIELDRALARCEREGLAAAVLFIDLDRFKGINDGHGHEAGDGVLQTAAARLGGLVRSDEFIARLGGDEFAVVVVFARGDKAAPEMVARRLLTATSAPFKVGCSDVYLGLSIGIAIAPEDATERDALVRRADLALYRAKRSGGGEFRYFEESMDLVVLERSAIERDLRTAIALGQIVPHFQPLVDLKSGHIIGFEALARWHHPTRGPIAPDKFISVAEATGQIGALTRSMMRQACCHANDWPLDIKLCVNLSPVEFRDPWLAESILAVLVETGFAPQRLEVEVTESALVHDLCVAHRILMSLRNQKIRIALDDFGVGYSSLKHLSALPFDRIKIDRSFVANLGKTAEADKIVTAIVQLAESLNMATTGEGVETIDTAKRLEALGCGVGQGWLFGSALPPEAALRLVQQKRTSQPLNRPDWRQQMRQSPLLQLAHRVAGR